LENLCSRWELSPRAGEQLAALLRFLDDSPDAPSSITDPAQAVDVHVADSLVGLEPLRAHPSLETIADLGSGAGFPGLPVAVALPDVRVDLVEATGRKCGFLERAIAAAQAENVRVVCERAEIWGTGAGRTAYSAVTVRAVGALPTVIEYAAPLLDDSGLLVAWRGDRDRADEEAGDETAAKLGLRPLEVRPVDPFAGAERRHLHTYERVGELPPGFPRRPGVARKRPLVRPRTTSRRSGDAPRTEGK
jgi:16S rRNA (guanine527-N7)-methyltransferase